MERVAVSTTCLWRIWVISTSIRYDYTWAKAGPKRKLCQVAKAVLKPIEQAMQPWIGGPRRTRRTPAHLAHPDPTWLCSILLDAFFVASLFGFGAARHFGMWWCCDTQGPWIWLQHLHGRWEDHRCLSGTLVSEQSGLHAGHGLDLVLALSCISYRHAMKSSQAERKRRLLVWTKTETFLSSPTMGRWWLPGAAFGCKFGNGSVDHSSQPVQHCNGRNRMTKQHWTTHVQSLPMCCCRPVGYFVGALWSTSRGFAFWVADMWNMWMFL